MTRDRTQDRQDRHNYSDGEGDGADLVADCRLMLRYASRNAMILPEELVHRIVRLDKILKCLGLRSVSDLDGKLVPALTSSLGPADGAAGVGVLAHADAGVLVLTIHGELSQVIAPTTALTLSVSEPEPGRHRILGGLPIVVKAAAFAAVCSAALFLVSAALIGLAFPPDAHPYLNLFLPMINIVGGACLGASFYVMLRTQPFLANRAYDPKYNAAYIARFVTGVIAGVILATAIGPTLAAKLDSVAGSKLGIGILSILGGYAAEAVELILQRLVDVIATLVRGDGHARIRAKAAHTETVRAAGIEEAANVILHAADMQAVKTAVRKLRSTVRKL